MSGKYLLDTNIVIALFAGEDAVLFKLGAADEIFVSSIVIGELCFGARKSEQTQGNLARIDEFVASNAILPNDVETARRYGEIKNVLREKGRPIPENDIWIAAVALQYDLILVTGDVHFADVTALNVETW